MKPRRLIIARMMCRWLPPFMAGHVRGLIYPHSLARDDSYQFVVRSRTGSLFKGQVRDFFAQPFAVHGYYNWHNWACVLAVCTPGDTIIEVGANVGTEMIGFSDIVGCQGGVVAFEPYPPNLASLREGLSLRRCDNVMIMPVALADESGTMQFNPPKDDNSGVGHVVYADGQVRADVMTVRCERLDDLAEQIGPAQFICMDAEGSEIFILRGGRRYLDTHRPAFIIEADPRHNLKRHGLTLRDVHDEIAGLGYTVFKIGRFGLETPDLEAPKGTDWFCLHNEKIEMADAVDRTIRRAAIMPLFRGLNPLVL